MTREELIKVRDAILVSLQCSPKIVYDIDQRKRNQEAIAILDAELKEKNTGEQA